jgi:kynureninase
MDFENHIEYARGLDLTDSLKGFREQFYIPLVKGKESIYFTGNSLGLQPKTTQDYIVNELEDWANFGVEGHFHARNPWVSYHELFPEKLSKIVGALPEEVVAMNQLTVNLHLLLITFYRPTKSRYKIICEAKAFSSDQYALESQVRLHGFDPSKAIVEVKPHEGEYGIRHEDIISAINQHGSDLALVLIGGVNYYTGQVFNMKEITAAAHEVGAKAGFDLAHAAGNIELNLHDWDVDFACWCSYKYLNSGPGGVAGAFIHQRHIADDSLMRLAGWWGHDKDTRFKMESGFKPMQTAEGWQLSNAPVLSMAAHLASLELFELAGMDKIVRKGKMLSKFAMHILNDINEKQERKVIQLITPSGEGEHGCQVSMLMLENGREVFDQLLNNGVIADWREPNVIRIAPVPLYNRFMEVYQFGEIVSLILNK